MAVLFDASVLIAYFAPKGSEDRRSKFRGLLKSLGADRARALIPAPALCEFLCKTDTAGDRYRELLGLSRMLQVVPFGERAAVECARLLDDAKSKADRKNEAATWAKAKFDWQIVSIGKVESVSAIYSLDRDIVSLGKRMGIVVSHIDDLPIPDDERQVKLPLAKPKGSK